MSGRLALIDLSVCIVKSQRIVTPITWSLIAVQFSPLCQGRSMPLRQQRCSLDGQCSLLGLLMFPRQILLYHRTLLITVLYIPIVSPVKIFAYYYDNCYLLFTCHAVQFSPLYQCQSMSLKQPRCSLDGQHTHFMFFSECEHFRGEHYYYHYRYNH